MRSPAEIVAPADEAMELGDIAVLVLLACVMIWYVRVYHLGRPPVRSTRSWVRLLWRILTYRRPN